MLFCQMSRKLRSGLAREGGDQRAKPKGWGMWGSNPKLPELGWWPLRHLRPGRGVWSCGQKHDSAAPEAHRGAMPAQSHRCHRCAREQASPWPSNLLSAFLRSLSVLPGGPVPAWCPLVPPAVFPHSKGEGLEDLFPSREKPRRLLHLLLPLPLDQRCGLHTLQARSCLPRAPAPALGVGSSAGAQRMRARLQSQADPVRPS